MVKELNATYISEIKPDFIYNRFDLFCDNYIVLMAERGQEKHVIEVRLFDNYAELGVWKMHISDALLKEISDFLFHKYTFIEYTKFFFCKTTGNYKKVNHFSIGFPDSAESFLQRRSSKSCRRLNNKRHQAEREVGQITFFEYNIRNCPEEVIKKYNIWKERTHHIGIIENINSFFQKYHISNTYVMYYGSNIAAILFTCEQCPIVYFENFSYDSQYSKYSPGQQIYEYMMIRLIEKKTRCIFLGGGDYDYKRYYGSIEEQLYDGVIFRNIYQRVKYNLITYYNKHLYWKVKGIKNKL